MDLLTKTSDGFLIPFPRWFTKKIAKFLTHFCTFLGFSKKIMKIQENHEIRRSKMVRGPQAATLIPALRRFELKLPNIFPRYYIFCFLISAFVSFLGTPEFCQKIVIFLKKWFLLKSLFLLRFGRNFVCELILATHLSVSTQNYPLWIF